MDGDPWEQAPILGRLTEVQGTAGAGKSRPLLAEIRTESGDRFQVVLKLVDPDVRDGTPWGACLARELVGSLLAARLGLATPQPAIVNIPPSAASMGRERERLGSNIGRNFGSVRQDLVLELIPIDADLWKPIIWFDAMCLNNDRRTGVNPNVLWTGSQLMVIDHGLVAPFWTFSLDGTTDMSLFGEPSIRLHAGARSLARTGANFADAAASWRQVVTPDFLAWVRSQVPAEWTTSDDLDRLVAFLAGRSRIAELQAMELEKVLGT